MLKFIKHDDVEPAELPALLAKIPVPQAADQRPRIWIATCDGWSFDYFPGLDGALRWYQSGELTTTRPVAEALGDCLEGRLFGPTGELKRRHIPALGAECMRLVFLGDEDWFPDDLQTAEMSALTHRPNHLVFCGSKTPITGGDWMELQMPHRVSYPVSETHADAKEVQLDVDEWLDGEGQVQFIRFRDLSTFSG